MNPGPTASAVNQGIDPVEFQRTLDAMADGIDQLNSHLVALPQAADAALAAGATPDPVATAIRWCVEQTVAIAVDLANVIIELIHGAAAPIMFLHDAYRWQDLRGTTTDAVGALNPALLPATGRWSGTAAAAYTRATRPQSDALTKLGQVADKISTSLQVCGAAGVVFYLAVGAVLVKLVAAFAVAIAAFGSEVFSLAGIALVLEEVGTTRAALATALGLLAAVLTPQIQQMTVLYGEVVDHSVFTGGHWPNAITAAYDDATVTDGDADWSLQRPR